MEDVASRLSAALEGRYAVEREIGQGGMATVYMARDLKHNRNVALKVLKPELAAVVGAERFLAEIETTANLQHPNILPLFDSGEADGAVYFVMPHVEGETLRDRIAREKHLPVQEAVRIATEVAEALDHAHRHGVVHRDIKPSNILLRDGRPLVSDFGIALAVRSGGGNRLTETGLSLGTPFYMSPEQATGDQQVGPATDIYALGCVLYEMLTGEPPYMGSTAQAVLGRIIQGSAAPVSSVRRSVPPNVEAAISKALERLPADRFGAAGEMARALADPGFRHGTPVGALPVRATRWRGAALVLASLLLVMSGAAAWALSRDQPLPRVVRSEITGAVVPELLVGTSFIHALSPDGRTLVYIGDAPDGGTQLWVRPLDQITATPLAGTQNASSPTFSPDGGSIAFFQDGRVMTMSLSGGIPAPIATASPPLPSMVRWIAGNMVYFLGEDLGVWRVPSEGGDAESIAAPADPIDVVTPTDVLPGGDAVLVTRANFSESRTEIAVLLPESGELRSLGEGFNARYAPSGHLVYEALLSNGQLVAAPFDIGRLEVTGPARPVVDDVFPAPPPAPSHWTLSHAGDLLYVLQSDLAVERDLVWVDRSGSVEAVDLGDTPGPPLTLALSPDDRRVALSLARPGSALSSSIWVKELPAGPLTRVTADSGGGRRAVWSSDGRSILYIGGGIGDPYGVRSAPADGSSMGESTTVLELNGVLEVLSMADGQSLLFRTGDVGAGAADVGIQDVQTGEITEDLLASGFNEFAIAVSPDGRWLAYVSDLTGRREVFVRPFPGVSTTQQQVSLQGGVEPVWAHASSELFYRDGATGAMIAASYVTEPTFQVVSREPLFDASRYSLAESGSYRSYDVSTDDQRFLMMRDYRGDGSPGAPRLILVQNFAEELRRTAPEER